MIDFNIWFIFSECQDQLYKKDRLEDGAQESEENPSTGGLIPCSFCCKMCKGIRGLEKHEKHCNDKKNLGL